MDSPPDENVLDTILARARRDPRRTAVVRPDRAVGFGEFAAGLAGVAAGLGAHGIAPGAVVAVQVADAATAMRVMFGAMLGGRVLLPFDGDLPPAERDRLLARAGATALVSDRADDPAAPVPTIRPGALPERGDPAAERRPGGERPAQIVLSSGTSGPSKASPASHRQLARRLREPSALLGMGPDSRYRPLIAMAFVLGRYPALRTLDAGGSVVLRPLPRTMPEVLAELNSDRVTYLQLTPNHVTQMLAALPADPATGPALPHMRAFVVTSAVVSMAMRRAIVERLTPALHTGYGSNESGYLTHATPADIAARPATVGRPLPDVTVEVVDDAGGPLPPGTIGEIRVRSPAAAERYVGDPETDARAYRDGWFHLGDTGRLDADGYLYLAGRLDDRINFGGRKLYPFEIEEVLLSHPDVAEAAALGLPSPVHQEVPVAAVVLRRPVPEADLIAYCAARLGAGKAPRHVVAFPELPRNAARKVPRAAIREAIRAQMQAGSGDTG